ncbi:hypothetical protein OH77DRAFT_619697 [Trametes cingulata]|nr:hypothetical protein OH77DRAFT_619697 [Trametes cingulata]
MGIFLRSGIPLLQRDNTRGAHFLVGLHLIDMTFGMDRRRALVTPQAHCRESPQLLWRETATYPIYRRNAGSAQDIRTGLLALQTGSCPGPPNGPHSRDEWVSYHHTTTRVSEVSSIVLWAIQPISQLFNVAVLLCSQYTIDNSLHKAKQERPAQMNCMIGRRQSASRYWSVVRLVGGVTGLSETQSNLMLGSWLHSKPCRMSYAE